MENTTKYAIAILRNSYQPDLQGMEHVKFYREDDGRNADDFDLFDSIEDARDKIDELEDEDYVLSHNEAGSPDYYIVEDRHADYIASGRNSDGSNYDWDDCDCTRNNGDCCGECDDCLTYMIDEDRQYIIDNADEA